MIIFVIYAKSYIICTDFAKNGCLCPKVGFIAGGNSKITFFSDFIEIFSIFFVKTLCQNFFSSKFCRENFNFLKNEQKYIKIVIYQDMEDFLALKYTFTWKHYFIWIKHGNLKFMYSIFYLPTKVYKRLEKNFLS